MILEIALADTWIQKFTDKSGVEHNTNENTHIVHRDCYKVTKLKYGDYTSLHLWNFIKIHDNQNILIMDL